jgi:protein-disulfide isomerase
VTNDRQARAARAEQMRKEREKAERKQRTEVIEPANLTEGGVDFPAPEGAASADAPVVELFEDFLCPACGSFEQLSGQFLQDQAASGAITLRFMPFSFLHNQSTNDYSRRATNVAMCAVDQDGPEAFWKVHDALYANQPAEGGAGPEDAELIDLATEAGVSDVESCVRTEKFVPWIDEMQDTFADEREVSGTPTVHIDGKASEARTPQELQAAIAEASKS